MQFIIMNYVPPEDTFETTAQGDLWGAYTRAMAEAGILVSGEALHPSHTAATLRLRNGTRDVQDGPFADAKEQLGGFYVIDVPDLDTALEWAARNPAAATGAVEVRRVVMRGA